MARRLSCRGIPVLLVFLSTVLLAADRSPAARASSSRAAQDDATPVPPRLLAGGTIYLKNDLQATRESMVLFREFRREMKRLDDWFKEAKKEEEAELVGILSSDPDVVERSGAVNTGIPYPSGYGTTKQMMLVIYDTSTNHLLWIGAEYWDTAATTGSLKSHQKLVRNLKYALEKAGSD